MKNESSYCLNAFGNRIFVGADSGRIYFSNDNGDNWNVINNGYSYVSIKTLDLLDNTIFAGTDSIGILLSSDNGDSWNKSSLGYYSIKILKSKGSSIYAGTLNGDFLISRDYGVNWIKSNLSDKPITCMSLSADNICVGSLGGGVFLSKDNGNSWIKCKADPLRVSYIFSILIDHYNIYKGGVGGFSVSSDMGLSWESKKIPGSEVSYINSILIIDNNIIAGTSHPMENIGVIKSSDNGNSWNYIGLDTLEINDLAFNTEYIFAIDYKGKIFRRKLNEFIKTDMQDDKLSPLESNISPNPASDFIEISVGANGCSPLQSGVRIYNVFGQIVNLTPTLAGLFL